MLAALTVAVGFFAAMAMAAPAGATQVTPHLNAITMGKQVAAGVYTGTYERRDASVKDFCPIDYVCLFQNTNANSVRGAYLAFNYSVPVTNLEDLSDVRCPADTGCSNGDLNNDMSSWTNGSPVQYCWLYDAHWRGAIRNMPVTGRAAFRNVDPADNDQASSLARC